MAVQQAEERTRRHPVRQGLIGGTLTTLGTLLLWMIAALIISIAVEWTGMALGWWEADGASHARAMRDQERTWLHSDVKQSVVTRDPLQFVDRISGQLTQLMFERTGFNAMLTSVAEAHPEEHSTVTTVRAAVAPIYEYLVAMVHITEVFGLRLAILALAMPLFGIVTLVALGEGILLRDLRRWSGGRESSLRYHLAKKCIKPMLIGVWVVYLSLPVSVHPTWVILPFALAYGVAMTITAASFKKYL